MPTTPAKTSAQAQLPIAATIEDVLIKGDLKDLTPEQRVTYYKQVCDSLGLNFMTRPFEYLTLNGRLVLYVKRDGTDQLRKIHNISVEIVSRTIDGDLLIVHVRATDRDGRKDEDYGAVPFKQNGTEAAANTIMKAITKAKRRATLSICGLGWLDETELEGVGKEQTRLINADQRKVLRDLARETESDLAWFFEHLSEKWELDIASLKDIPASHFEDARNRLIAKREAMSEQPAEADLQP
jgi:hypothetical protein